MTPFTQLQTIGSPLPVANIDTDQLIPARFMSRSRKDGYGDYLLHAQRFAEDGTPRAGFPLNDQRFAGAQVLVALRNFGSGSSREAAVYALADYGFRCVIAPSFGDIFAANAVNNGVLPARVSDADARMLIDLLAEHPSIQIDLETQRITVGNHVVDFTIDPVWRMKLLNGWDDLDLTASYAADIAAFQARDAKARPWVAPGGGD